MGVAFSTYLNEPTHRIFVEFPFLRVSGFAEERRIHRHPTHDEIDEPTERIIVKELAAHREIQLHGPFRSTEQNAGYCIHVKERAVVGNEQKRPLDVGLFDILDAENVHQIVCGEIDPETADMPLEKRHQAFPCTEIHSVRQPKRHPFGPPEDTDLLRLRHQRRFWCCQSLILFFCERVHFHQQSVILASFTCTSAVVADNASSSCHRSAIQTSRQEICSVPTGFAGSRPCIR